MSNKLQARPGLWTSSLLYSGPGSGKTTYSVSSFWDWKNGCPVLLPDGKEAKGRLISFGREYNPALAVPDKYQMLGDMSLRFRSPSLDDMSWVNDFRSVVNGLLMKAREGDCLDALVIDGMSEFDLLYEMVHDNKFGGEDKFAKWNDLMSELLAIMQRLDPDELGCHVFVTARVMEKKQAKKSRNVTIAGDPAYVDYDYYPSLRGGFRLHFPHYFNMVLYMETKQLMVAAGDFAGKRLPAHVLHMVRTGDFYVKNVWEYPWLKAREPLELVNVGFWDVYNRLVDLTKGGTEQAELPEAADFVEEEHVEGGSTE